MRRILSVDDDLTMLECFATTLNERGYEVTTTSEPTEAGRMLDEGDYSLVMLDVEMPEKDGFEVFEEVKRKYRHLPVLFVTGFPGSFSLDSDEKMALWQKEFADGNTDILYKPFTATDLYAKVEGLIGEAEESTDQ